MALDLISIVASNTGKWKLWALLGTLLFQPCFKRVNYYAVCCLLLTPLDYQQTMHRRVLILQQLYALNLSSTKLSKFLQQCTPYLTFQEGVVHTVLVLRLNCLQLALPPLLSKWQTTVLAQLRSVTQCRFQFVMPIPNYILQRAYAVTNVTKIFRKPTNYKQTIKKYIKSSWKTNFKLLLQISTKSILLQNRKMSLHISPIISVMWQQF